MRIYDWTPAADFVNRNDDLARLESWWVDSGRDALAVIGRRRVGKSWLLRRFAHHKPAVILVADEILPTTQMARFADQIEPVLGVRPEIGGAVDLIRLLLSMGKDEKFLAVIDEFPLLVPPGAEGRRTLSGIQAALEELRDESRTKLVFCGSLVGQMEGLLATASPLHGRLQRLDVLPLTFAESRHLTDPGDSADDRITRYSVAGGMSRYLRELGKGQMKEAVCDRVLSRNGPLFDDPRSVLEQELREPATYLSILGELALRPASGAHLSKALGVSASSLAPYLRRLAEMRLVMSNGPVGSAPSGRKSRHQLQDGFARFWFRFVRPFQEALQSGLRPEDLWEAEIAPALADFTSPAFEELCVQMVRLKYGAVSPQVGAWWGNALNRLRRSGDRTSEEIDIIAAHGRNVKIAGECKWTTDPMPAKVLEDLRNLKLPALAEEGRLRIPASGPKILLFSRSGFAPVLTSTAATDPNVELITPEELVRTLEAG